MTNFGIVTCPKCNMRVVPKQDGTCPSCQSILSPKESATKQKSRNTASGAQPNWYERYWNWVKAEVISPKVTWDKFDKPKIQNFLSLDLQDLCHPLFPVDPNPPKRDSYESDERLHKIWDRYNKIKDPVSTDDVASLLVEISKSNVLSIFPEFDLTYVAQALALARISRFGEAEASLETGFNNCAVKSALCKAMGDVKLWEQNPVAFGWYMQACLLGYESLLPYLELSEAANALGMTEIGIRLLNASDILSTSMLRKSPDSDTRFIARKDSKKLQFALEEFLRFADTFLPPDDILPPIEKSNERAQWLILCKGNPEGGSTAIDKILNRKFAHVSKNG